ncbi:MAG: DnaA N-terminal domain-containing protein [Yoonia sp.]|uniref:DnaA N-terminal domain-containing protein n=1 Tax=Yoonia sp. TaxID=2212373 RepID=UPI003EF88CEE
MSQSLQEQISAAFAAWFCHLTVSDIVGDRWVFIAPSPFAANYIKTHLRDRLLVAFSAVNRTV